MECIVLFSFNLISGVPEGTARFLLFIVGLEGPIRSKAQTLHPSKINYWPEYPNGRNFGYIC